MYKLVKNKASDFEKGLYAVLLAGIVLLGLKTYTLLTPEAIQFSPQTIPYFEQQAYVAVYGPPEAEKRAKCKRDTDCTALAEAIVYEARGEPTEGAAAVGYVILERVNNPDRWPDSIRGVVTQSCQFSYRCERQRRKPDPDDWKRAYVLAWDVIHKKIDNPIEPSDHYHTTEVNPWWAKHMTYVATVGNHKFYKE